jgi:hypothetical protein
MYADMKLLAMRGRFATFADAVFCRVHFCRSRRKVTWTLTSDPKIW